jgi:ADP-ribose pyrophosphatase
MGCEMEIYRGKRLSVEKKVFRLPNGTEREKVVIHPGNAAVMLPIEGDACILLRQYRFVIDEYIYEAPAGTLNPGETPAECARRELIEEARVDAGTLIPRGFIWTTPGFTDEKLFLFEARDLVPSDAHPQDENEIIEIVRVPNKEVLEMIRDGRICDAKTICIAMRCLG